jgi:hypothetical protein
MSTRFKKLVDAIVEAPLGQPKTSMPSIFKNDIPGVQGSRTRRELHIRRQTARGVSKVPRGVSQAGRVGMITTPEEQQRAFTDTGTRHGYTFPQEKTHQKTPHVHVGVNDIEDHPLRGTRFHFACGVPGISHDAWGFIDTQNAGNEVVKLGRGWDKAHNYLTQLVRKRQRRN